jgi:16S rRNA processing protein RimM
MSAPARSGADAEFVIVGRVRKAHGIRGELVVEPITDAPQRVFASGQRVFAGTVRGDLAPDRRELHIDRATRFKEGLIVAFREIADRNAAEQWRNRFFLVPSGEVPALDAGEIYVHELLGMRVQLASGTPLGEVVDVYELPHGLAIDVKRDDGNGTVLLLYEQSVHSADRERRTLTVTVPDGLLD